MNRNAYRKNAYLLLYLIRCVLNGTTPSRGRLDDADLNALYAVAKAHSLTAIGAYGLEKAGICDKAFEEAKLANLRKNTILDTERAKVTAELEKTGIWYAPLKGAVLKCIYPAADMRQMADNDILFDPEYREEVRRIFEALGFKTEAFRKGNHDVYHKPPVSNFEMHVSLFGESFKDSFYAYYKDVGQRLRRADDSELKLEFTDDDFYIYMTAHEYKHFSKGGTGLRSLVDAYVFLRHFQDRLDMDHIGGELDKLGIREYELSRRQLVFDIFERGRIAPEQRRLLDYYVFSGTYGTIENSVRNATDRTGSSKLKYIFRRVFIPMKSIKGSYPFFYRHKYLIPFLIMYRMFRMVTVSRKRVLSEVRALGRA